MNKIKIELGPNLPSNLEGSSYNNIYAKQFFRDAEIDDVLDSITLIHKIIPRPKWKEFVERAFREEGLDYTLDEECGVHPYVDAEFQHNKTSTLRCLQKEELKGVKHEFEQAFDKLNSSRKDTKGAIKAINEAVEKLAKNMDGINEKNLDEAIPKLDNILNEVYKKDKVLLDASKAVKKSLKEWNISCHQYRHGKDADKINNPSDEYTILMLSQGASYIRWLLDVEQLYIKAKESGQQK